ncbi:hypothetical protein [Kibdelosporangium aridum]|uniref:hypothetical protein n=1 Tax=Kibdelosporangium aridum TaxID=2030 RepID=UPI0035ED17B2
MTRHHFRRVTSVVAATAMLVGMAQPAVAAEPPVKLSDGQIADALFSAAMYAKASGLTLDKDAIATAEFVDWRAKNPTADARTSRIHLANMRAAYNSQLTTEQAEQPHADVIRRLITITYAQPGAVITGPNMTNMLGVATGRDLYQAIGAREDRLTGMQQRLDLDVQFTQASTTAWKALRARAATDAVAAQIWTEQIGAALPGQSFGLSATATTAELKALPPFQGVLDFDKINAEGAKGKTALVAEVMRQYAPVQANMISRNDQISNALAKANAEQAAPGGTKATPPDPATLDQAKKDFDARQKYLDAGKAIGEGLVEGLKSFDKDSSTTLLTWVETVYKLASAANKLVQAVQTLATTTGVGATFGGVGAVVGAAVGLVQVISGLLNGGGDQAAQRQILAALSDGFAKVQNTLRTIYTTMNNRFDRVDVALSKIYGDMMAKFKLVVDMLYQLQGSVNQLHQDLLNLQTKVEAFGKATLDSLSNIQKRSFVDSVGTYVDYPAYNGGRTIPDYGTFEPQAGMYMTMATDHSHKAPFVAGGDIADPQLVLAQYGTAGTTDWLADWANHNLGTTLSTNLGNPQPNMDMWAEAARAYYLIASQNPQWATRDTAQGRANAILSSGSGLPASTAQFTAADPTAPDKVNKLFKGLDAEYRARMDNFTNSVRDMRFDVFPLDRRDYDIFQPNILPQAGFDKLSKLPDAAKPCTATPGRFDVPRRDRVVSAAGGGDRGYRWSIGRYLDPSWKMNLCYDVIKFSQPGWSRVCNSTSCVHRSTWSLDLNFYEVVENAPGGPYRTYSHPARKYFKLCEWRTGRTDPAPTSWPIQCSANDEISPDTIEKALSVADNPTGNAGADVVILRNPDVQEGGIYPPAGVDPVRDLISDRIADYYNLVASKADAALGAHELDNLATLYQAFVSLGMPRAKMNDDQLRALLFGAHGIPANLPATRENNMQGNPLIAGIYAEAALAVKANKYKGPLPVPLLSDGNAGDPPIDCRPFQQDGRDALGDCLASVAKQRADRLYGRIALHFQAIASGAESPTSPLLQEAMDNLKLQVQWAKASMTP